MQKPGIWEDYPALGKIACHTQLGQRYAEIAKSGARIFSHDHRATEKTFGTPGSSRENRRGARRF